MATYQDFFRGIGKSKYDQNGFDNLVNCDVHSETGALKCQLALVSESATPNEECISASLTNGEVFFFSTESGKIWKRTTAGVYSLVHTNTNGSHAGAMLFDGYLYYTTNADLGRIAEANASSESTWSSQTDDWAAYTNDNANKPMHVMNLSLFIGDGNLVASVDNAGTFSANVLDLTDEFVVTALTGVGTDLLIGTTIGSNINSCKVYLWDTFSASWTLEDELPEIAVNAFIPSDNITFAQCGDNGQIYYWTGAKMEKYKRIRGVTTAINPYNATLLDGKSLFATGAKIFSLHREDRDLPYIIVQEYTLTTGTSQSLISTGTQLLVSTGSNIDKIGTSYGSAVVDTPEEMGRVQSFRVKYDSIGSGGAIGISVSSNGGAFSAKTAITDSDSNEVYHDGGLGSTNFVQGRITLTPSGANQISIKQIETK